MPSGTVFNEAGFRQLRRSSQVRHLLLDLSQGPVRRMRAGAPKLTGAGAASIHAEVVLEGGEWQVRMSWDRRHYYMFFQNQGTDRGISAKHFLERGLGVSLLKRP